MKKTIKILGVFAFAMTMFFNVSFLTDTDTNSDFNLISLILINEANADVAGSDETRWKTRTCPGTSVTYEVCWYSGDGNLCSPWGKKTRECN